MKKTITLVTIIIVGLISCNQNSDTLDNGQTIENVPTETPANAIPIDFVKTFEGQINNKYDIQMKITSNNGNITGKYFYKKVGKDIVIKGTIDNQGKISISEFDNKGNQTGLFEGKMPNENKIEGTWSKPNGSNSMPFYLLASNTSYETSKKEIKTSKYDNITGTYQSPLNDGGISMGTVKIMYLGNNRFYFEITTSHQAGCTGEASGTGIIDNNGIGRWSGDGCESLTFKFSNGTVNIDEKNCDLHGMRCWFEGEYKK